MSTEKFKCAITGKEFEEKDCKKIILPDGMEIVVSNEYVQPVAELLSSVFSSQSATEASQNFSETINVIPPKEMYARICERVVGQEIAKKKMSVAVHRHYKYILSEDENKEWKKGNILFIGDSGCGKTHISRTIAQMAQVPFVTGDCTQITEAGYVGDDAEVVLASLLAEADNNPIFAQMGIVFLDEIDKIAKKSGGNPSLTRDVSGEGVQQALLKMVEGTIAHVQRLSDGKRKNPKAQTIPIDTSDILFIGAGVFPGLEDIIAKRLNFDKKIGFRSSQELKIENNRSELLSLVQAQDLIDYGFISEFVGRFPIIIPFSPLSRDDMMQILTSIKGSYLEQAKWIFAENDLNINIAQEALELIVDCALEDPRGARALQSIMESFLMELYYENVGENTGDITIDCDFVKKYINISKLK